MEKTTTDAMRDWALLSWYELAVFAGVHKYPARVKCAILAWHAVMGALKDGGGSVTTESEQV